MLFRQLQSFLQMVFICSIFFLSSCVGAGTSTSPSNSPSVYFSDTNGVFQNNRKIGETSSVLVSHDGVIYAAHNGNLFYKDIKTSQWIALSSNKLDWDIRSVAFNKDTPYVSTYTSDTPNNSGNIYKLSNGKWELLNKPGYFDLEVLIVIKNNIIYASTWSQGVFKANLDEGSTIEWKPLGNPGRYINSLAVDESGTIYVAELSTNKIYSSTIDSTWVLLDSSVSADAEINAIASSENTLYVGTRAGQVLKSTDNNTLSLINADGLGNSGIDTIAIDSGKLYVGTEDGNIFSLELDGGTSWSNLYLGEGLAIDYLTIGF
ncbi:MAG: PQQ-binding-like beta-propeller repeat protein [Proteobacteria bacterium]|nr:PQQ-binding-like beta-propeller repeat protein [Pseudomonadota bacterium]